MKIISAKCHKGDARRSQVYVATLEVSSDGVSVTQTQEGDTPDEALHRALSAALAEFDAQCRKTLRAEINVKF